MPHKGKKRCVQPGCMEKILKGKYCDDHRPTPPKPKDTKPKDKRYKSQRWKREREKFLRHHPLCVECERLGKVRQANVVDHIQAVNDGGEFWSRDNWQPLCRDHHQAKTLQEMRDRKKKKEKLNKEG